MEKWNYNDLYLKVLTVGTKIEILMDNNTIQHDVIDKGKYGNYETRYFDEKHIKAWRFA